ncbi:MAG: hypothetical protein GXO00_00730 [Candidatus Diapherotrites archaeon]|nr:hypothetical protein [Candidatus Diapherotrites archaeon]
MPKIRVPLEWVAAILLALIVFLLLGKVKVGEYAEGFYIVRPTYWHATPTEINVEFTSFYPANLICEINTPYGSFTEEIAPRGSVVITLRGDFQPNSFVKIPVSMDCGVVREEGTINAFVFT